MRTVKYGKFVSVDSMPCTHCLCKMASHVGCRRGITRQLFDTSSNNPKGNKSPYGQIVECDFKEIVTSINFDL